MKTLTLILINSQHIAYKIEGELKAGPRVGGNSWLCAALSGGSKPRSVERDGTKIFLFVVRTEHTSPLKVGGYYYY